MDRFAARKVAVEKLKELGALEKEEPYENKIGFSQRARVPDRAALERAMVFESIQRGAIQGVRGAGG
jgi:valyl-tRNA synthetase